MAVTLATMMDSDMAVFFNADNFGETITFAGTSTVAIVLRETVDDQQQIDGTDQVSSARILLKRNDIASPALGNIAVFDSINWETTEIIRQDAEVAEVRVTNIQNQLRHAADYRPQKV